MNFQIVPLNHDDFAHLFALSDAALRDLQACRQVVTEKPGTPCRVSLEDADVGETVILINYEHLPENSPFRARHAIFVRENVAQADIATNEVPAAIESRLVSLRFFDRDHMMIDADVVSGERAAAAISAAFENTKIDYAHIHYAKPGCFAASVQRVE